MTTPKSFLCYCLTFSSTAYSAAAKVKPEALQIGVNFMLGKNTKKMLIRTILCKKIF